MTTTTKVLNAAQQAFTAGSVAFAVAGVVFAVIGRHARGFTLIAVGVILALFLLLLRLYEPTAGSVICDGRWVKTSQRNGDCGSTSIPTTSWKPGEMDEWLASIDDRVD